ncbi:MAG TPA: hypothetical protein VFM18_13530 [Methanosarcina sp.]|nr:hypothetical protein [Methanosarcina sp.]
MTTQQNPLLHSNDWKIISHSEGFYTVTNGQEHYNFLTYEFASSCLKVFTMHNQNYWYTLLDTLGCDGSIMFRSCGTWDVKLRLSKDVNWIGSILLVLFGFDALISTNRIEKILEVKEIIKTKWNCLLWGTNGKGPEGP